ncbi:MAG: hypothetical protein R3F55_21840 [Alphaproteobacteria bacterium]
MTAPDDGPDHVLYEFVAIGNNVRVAAVDPRTLAEVTVVGPQHAIEMLKRIARRKLGRANARTAAKPMPTQSGWDL